MNEVPQMATVADLRHKHLEVFTKLRKGPVIIAQRSKPAAVRVSVDTWDKLAAEMKRLRRMVEFDRQFAEMDAGNVVEFDISQAPT
jgi:prevent-host-death family protein